MPGGSEASGPERISDNADAGVFELAREEELRLLELQRTELENARTRCSQFLAFVGSASAFLAGSSLRATTHDVVFYVCVGASIALSALCVALAFALLTNWNLFRLCVPSGRRMVWSWGSVDGGHHALDYATSDVPRLSKELLARKLAERYNAARALNAPNIVVVRWTYVAFLTVACGQLIAWIVVVCLRGT